MKTRMSEWFDIDTGKPRYGIKVYHHRQWINAKDNNGPYFFDTVEECEAKRKELRKVVIGQSK